MRLIKLTSIEKRQIAVCVNEIVSVERGDYVSSFEREYGFSGCPTRVILKNGKYTVREDFDVVCDLIKGEDNEN